MKHRRSFGVVALVAGTAVVGVGQMLHAAEMASMVGSHDVSLRAMGESHRVRSRDISGSRCAM